jgi:two-component system phosphate regulon sensor histidine kinase PhoR
MNPILIVDDDANLRRTLADILKVKGYLTVDAANGTTALTRVRENNPSIALIDLKLPDMDGLALLRQIRQESPSSECIVLTGHASQTSAIEAVNLGAYSYVQKPYDMGQLLVMIRRAIEKREAEEALRESEELYRTLVNTAPDAVTATNLHGEITYVSQRTLQLHGYDSVQELLGKSAFELIALEDREKAALNLQRTLTEGVVRDLEYTMVRKDGTRFFGELSAALINDAHGIPKAFIATTRDITERKQAQEALRDYTERLETRVADRTAELQDALQKTQTANRLQTEFIANINHELRTPLTNLLLYHQMLSEQPLIKTEERLSILGRELHRLLGLIEELLSLSRLDAGQVTFHPAPHDLNRLIENLINDRCALAEKRGLTLRMDLYPNLPQIKLDEPTMVQAISNLLTNALNYTPKGGEVSVRTWVEVRDHRPLAGLSVQDTGPGIDKDDIPYLFERFYRGKAGHESGEPGTGLGLAIVKQVVERHHGQISVGNRNDNGGAIFTIWLALDTE